MKLQIPPYTVEVTRKKMRSIQLRITLEGDLKMSIPQQISLEEAEEFVRKHLQLITRKREELQNSPLVKKDAQLMFGQPFEVRVIPGETNHAEYADGIMTIYAKAPEDDTITKELMEKCILQMLKERAGMYLRFYAEKLGVEVPDYHFHEMKSRWGSYSLKTKRISLNKRLINLDERCLAYVAAHELCHIRHPNHGEEYHRLLDEIMPENREILKLFR
ncbi:MAG: DUF45 domain-containing protein [Clostridia bacterium]|nr:DUF45 domain-containing protein [Clostridia bacterium]